MWFTRLTHRYVCLAGALLLALVSLSPLLLAPLPVQAQATITVTNGNDSGPGSLREAITAAQPGDTITFDRSVATVTLTSAQLTISTTLTIDGGTTGVTIVRSDEAGTPDFRIFEITGGDVTLDSLTIRNGLASVSPDNSGGGIRNDGGTLTVINSTLSGNTASDDGGGIANISGTLEVTTSTLSGNRAVSSNGYCWRNPTPPHAARTGCGWRATNRDVRVWACGCSRCHASNRTRLIAVAVSTCWRWVLASPT